MVKHYLIALSVAAISLVGCNVCSDAREADVVRVEYSGHINDDLLEMLRPYNGTPITLVISSHGGFVTSALDVAELAQRNNWSLEIKGECWSACAEIIVHGFDRITITTGHLSFHGNSRMKNNLYRLGTGDWNSQCALQHEARRKALYSNSGANYDFWRRVKQEIEPSNVTIIETENNECGKINYSLNYAMWIPNSETLRRDYGIEFVGEQPTDNLNYAIALKRIIKESDGRDVKIESIFINK